MKDSNGEPMIGVTITDQNGKAGGITDLDGNFTIQNVEPNTVLTFSYIGCKTQKNQSRRSKVMEHYARR